MALPEIIAIGSLLLQGVNFLTGIKQQKKADDLAADAQVSSLEASLAMNKMQLLESNKQLSIYEQALSNLPAAQAAEQASFESSAKAQFDTLMSNFEMANVSAAAKGQIGGGTSAGLVTAKQQEKVADFAGSDLTLNDDTEGLYGLSKTSLLNDQAAEMAEIESSIDIYRQSIDILKDTQASLSASLKKANRTAEMETGSVLGNLIKRTIHWGIKL